MKTQLKAILLILAIIVAATAQTTVATNYANPLILGERESPG